MRLGALSTRAAVRQALRRLLYLWNVTLHLAGRELEERHRDSLLGWIWSLTPPLLTLAVTHFLFTRVIPLGVEDYALFLFIGILAWTWFSRSLTAAAGALEQNRNLVLRPGFPTVLLPVVSVVVSLVDYLIALPVLFVVLAVTTGVRPEAAFLPLLLLVQLLLTVGLAWSVAVLQVFFRDIRHIVGLVVALGFWITPVFYRQKQVPEQFSFIYDLNPMAYIVEAHRGLLLSGNDLPSAEALAGVSAFAAVVLAAGFAVFRALSHAVPDRL